MDPRIRRTRFVLGLFYLLLCWFSLLEPASSSLSPFRSRSISSSCSSPQSLPAILQLRGGASKTTAQTSSKKKKRKKTKKKSSSKRKQKSTSSLEKEGTTRVAEGATTTATKQTTEQGKREMDKALHETTDAAQALGNAIRSRADELRSTPFLASIDNSVSSLGWALGASDHVVWTSREQDEEESDQDADHGGVEGAPASVVVHYFLKSHGGAHALQCACSLLASVAGLGVMVLPPQPASLKTRLVLLQRCLLFAMIKHVSGLLAACLVAAKAIPEVGLSQTRVWMEQLATDPVSQYVFYAACGIVWLSTARKQEPLEWWESSRLLVSLLVGPILLREVLSTLLVLSDVLVLWACNTAPGQGQILRRLVSASQSVVNAIMSLLVTPSVWQSADASQRQAILAKLTSRTSLVMEVLVGLFWTVDAARTVAAFSFASVTNRPPVSTLLVRLLCTRLYLHFLWMRKKRITKLASTLRGGCSQVPFYVLDCLADPRKAMGLSETSMDDASASFEVESADEDDDIISSWTWRDYARIALDLDASS